MEKKLQLFFQSMSTFISKPKGQNKISRGSDCLTCSLEQCQV